MMPSGIQLVRANNYRSTAFAPEVSVHVSLCILFCRDVLVWFTCASLKVFWKWHPQRWTSYLQRDIHDVRRLIKSVNTSQPHLNPRPSKLTHLHEAPDTFQPPSWKNQNGDTIWSDTLRSSYILYDHQFDMSVSYWPTSKWAWVPHNSFATKLCVFLTGSACRACLSFEMV